MNTYTHMHWCAYVCITFHCKFVAIYKGLLWSLLLLPNVCKLLDAFSAFMSQQIVLLGSLKFKNYFYFQGLLCCGWWYFRVKCTFSCCIKPISLCGLFCNFWMHSIRMCSMNWSFIGVGLESLQSCLSFQDLGSLLLVSFQMWHVNIEVANWFFLFAKYLICCQHCPSCQAAYTWVRGLWYTTRISIPASALPSAILGLNSTVIDIYYKYIPIQQRTSVYLFVTDVTLFFIERIRIQLKWVKVHFSWWIVLINFSLQLNVFHFSYQ